MYQVRHAPNLFVGGSRYSCKALRPRSAAMTHVRRAGRQSYHVQSIPKAPRSPAHYDLSTLPKGKTWECNGNVYTGVMECFVVGARSRQSRFGAHRHISVIGFLACYIVW